MKLYFYDKKKAHKRENTNMMIRESLNEYISGHSLAPYNGEIKRTALGKPYIDYPLHIGVTHSDDTVIIAIDKHNIGIDCEKCGRVSARYESIMKKFFTKNERNYVKSCKDEKSAFLDTWVKKEAVVKFSGEGLAEMAKVDVTALNGFEKIENDRNLIIYIYKEQDYE